MTIASYNDLKTSVSDFIHRSDNSTAVVDQIMLGEKRIQRELRTADMETAYTGTIASGVIAVPTDFLEWRAVYINDSVAYRLEPKTWEWVLSNYPQRSADSIPKFIARNASNFEFGPYPDSGYSVKGTYYKRLTAVASSWNALATANPDLYLAAALAYAHAYIGNEEAVRWDAVYREIRDSLNLEARKQDISGGPLRVTAG